MLAHVGSLREADSDVHGLMAESLEALLLVFSGDSFTRTLPAQWREGGTACRHPTRDLEVLGLLADRLRGRVRGFL